MRFLSVEWLDLLDRALRETGVAVDDGRIVVDQAILEGDRVTFEYHLVLDSSGARVVAGASGEADVSFSMDAATAAQIARGHENVQQALSAGRCRVSGHPERLARAQIAVQRVGETLSALREVTEYPE